MKGLIPWSISAALLAGLAVFMVSAIRSSEPEQAASPIAKLAARGEPPATTRVQQPSLRPAAHLPSREEQSQQLQLEIARALASADDAERQRAYTQLLRELIAIDPAAMKRLVEHYPAGLIREQLLRNTAHTWSALDLQGAIAWAKGVGDDGERVVAATEIVSQVGQTDPGHAIEVSDVLGVGRNDGTVEHIAQLWAMQNLQASLDWTEAQPPGAQRDQVLARIIPVEAARSPPDAANTALQQMSPGPAQTNAIASVVHEWSVRDTAAASTWIQGLPQGPLRDVANGELARTVRDRALASVGSP